MEKIKCAGAFGKRQGFALSGDRATGGGRRRAGRAGGAPTDETGAFSTLAAGAWSRDACGVTRVAQIYRAGLSAALLAAGIATARGETGAATSERWPIRGGLAGEVKVEALAELGLSWRIEARAEGLMLRAERAGLELELSVEPEADGRWGWSVRRGALDVAELWPLMRGRLGEEAAGWSASGRVELTGAGIWSAESGPEGELRMTLREGWARSDELEAELSGVELDVATQDLANRTLAPGQELRVNKASVAGAEMSAVKVKFGMNSDQVLEVAGGEAEFLGGRVRVRPFALPLMAPAMTATADVEALQLGEAARLLPWLLQTAQGKLRGRVELSWDVVKGLRVRDGGLDIVRSDDAAFRFAPSPGLLTGEMPEKFTFLPWRWTRWFGLTNPVHDPLEAIELGREGLRIEEFRVDFWPDGQGVGRTATIHILGRPTGGKFVEEVKLDLNFHGPWSEFIAFGLNNELSGFSFRVE